MQLRTRMRARARVELHVRLGVAAALLVWIAAAARAAEAVNQCVHCHESQPLPIALGHSVEEWRVSAHARADVGCEKCHGGDATVADAEQAHRGVKDASDRESLVHPRNLARTCGTCHVSERQSYDATVHASQVKEHGKGATCMTCHGAMATSLPSPSEMSARCAVCHAEPLRARVALVMLAQTKLDLHRAALLLEKAPDEAKTSEPEWHAEAEKRLASLEEDYAGLQLTWHTFDMEATLAESRAILKLVDLLEQEARLRLERGH